MMVSPHQEHGYLIGFEGFNPFSGVPLVHQNSSNHMWKRPRCTSISSVFNAVISFFSFLFGWTSACLGVGVIETVIVEYKKKTQTIHVVYAQTFMSWLLRCRPSALRFAESSANICVA